VLGAFWLYKNQERGRNKRASPVLLDRDYSGLEQNSLGEMCCGLTKSEAYDQAI
jgi:hypothetical protein